MANEEQIPRFPLPHENPDQLVMPHYFTTPRVFPVLRLVKVEEPNSFDNVIDINPTTYPDAA